MRKSASDLYKGLTILHKYAALENVQIDAEYGDIIFSNSELVPSEMSMQDIKELERRGFEYAGDSIDVDQGAWEFEIDS